MKFERAALARARIRRPRNKDEIKKATEFLKTPHAPEILEAHPEERGSMRFMEIDDKIVAALLFNPREFPVREAHVGCARIFETDAEDGRHYFRRTGDRELFDLMIEELLGYLWVRGYPLCYAHGELALYVPQGFSPCFYHPRVSIDVKTALALPANYRVRRLKSDDIRKIPSLRAGNGRFKPQVFGTGVPPFHHFCVETPERELKGYLSLEVNAESTWKPKVFVPEVEATSRNAVYTILNHCAQKAQEVGLDEIHFPLAPGHPFALACLELGGHSRIKGAAVDPMLDEEMVHVVCPMPLLEALRPGMEARVERSPFAHEDHSISIRTDRGAWSLRAQMSAMRITEEKETPEDAIRLPDWIFTQLLMGYRSAHEVPVKMDREDRDLLHVLFPKAWPYSMPDPDLWDEAEPPIPYTKAGAKAAAGTKLPWVLNGRAV